MLLRTSLDDPRLSVYHEIKDRPLLDQGLFLAEGEQVVKRLLASPRIETASVLLAESRVAELGPLIPQAIPVFVLPGSDVSSLLGFKFHSGVIAAGKIPPSAPITSVIPRTGPVRLVVLPEISAAENLGTLIRLSAGLGADALVTGERCTSPWMRRTVRVSMGTVFYLPVIESKTILADLHTLNASEVETVATVLRPEAEILGARPASDRTAILFGSEGQGLREEEIQACSRLVTIPMSLGVDSLNVGISAAIILHEFFKRPRPTL